MRRPNKTMVRIFLNPYCNYGTALARWKKVKVKIHNRIGAFELEEIVSPDEIVLQVSNALRNGENMFVAAGGDGTVNLLLNAIMKLSDNPNTIIGAVGLGSSNDFHKPFRPKSFINGIPVKIDFENAVPCDVIQIRYQNTEANWGTRFCLINASVGLTAEANAFFNLRHTFMKMLQRVSVNAAILYATLRTILTYHDKSFQLIMNNGEKQRFMVTNLGIIKNPHFTGTLCYDTAIEPDDGKLGINLCRDLSLYERIETLIALYNHRFKERPKTKSWFATQLSLKSDKIFALEMDGEVIHTNNAEFNIIPKRVRCCR